MDYKTVTIDIILFTALVIAVITDLKTRKIYDKLTYPVAIAGFLLNGIFYGIEGLRNSAIGWVLGVVLLFIFGFGGGDLKLLGAIGSLKGWFFVLWSIVYTAIAGGIFIIIYLIIKGRLLKTFYNSFLMIFKPSEFKKEEEEKLYVPYGPMIFLGVLWYYLSLKYDFLSLVKL